MPVPAMAEFNIPPVEFTICPIRCNISLNCNIIIEPKTVMLPPISKKLDNVNPRPKFDKLADCIKEARFQFPNVCSSKLRDCMLDNAPENSLNVDLLVCAKQYSKFSTTLSAKNM